MGIETRFDTESLVGLASSFSGELLQGHDAGYWLGGDDEEASSKSSPEPAKR